MAISKYNTSATATPAPRQPTRSTVYFHPEVHQALRVRAAHTKQTLSEFVNNAVREALREDLADLQAFEDRAAEPTITYEALLHNLKADGKL